MPLLDTPHLTLRVRLPRFPTPHNPRPAVAIEAQHSFPHGLLARAACQPLRHVAAPAEGEGEGEGEEVEDLGTPSAEAVAEAIRRASSASPVRFRRVHREEDEEPHGEGGFTEPSADFRRLCAEQLEMFRVVVSRDAVLSVYVRPAGSYIMDQLELRRVALYPETNVSKGDTVMLVGNFTISAGLRAAEAFLVKRQMEIITEFGAVVLPMVKHPFVVGFLVAELPELVGCTKNSETADIQIPSHSFLDKSSDITPYTKGEAWDFQTSGDQANSYAQLVTEWKNSALMISRTLAMAYVMDQIRGPLANIRALAKMLSVHTKRNEISYDIVEDILIQGDHLKDALQQIQDAVYLTKVNIVRYNEETLKKIQGSPSSRTLPHFQSDPKNSSQKVDLLSSHDSDNGDMVIPMPPLCLASLQHQDARPCDLSVVLQDLVGAAQPLAFRQQRTLDVTGIPHPLQVAVEESALRQALSNLIESALLRTQLGGRVQIYAGEAPAGGILVVIDDDGPDMQFMTQMHCLAPFGSDLLADGLTVAREILENYGCVLRVISPRRPDAVIGTGGSRIEIWLPTSQTELSEITEGA
uniref:Histidine kinase domain-containing protein n=1 Tax=Oryza punctata TaxID=4537 RepID=A0A0E0MLJ7_ORYPU